MKSRIASLSTGFAALTIIVTTALCVSGCNSNNSADTAASTGGAGAAAVVKSTPPPTLDLKGAQAQNDAARKAGEEAKKRMESGQK